MRLAILAYTNGDGEATWLRGEEGATSTLRAALVDRRKHREAFPDERVVRLPRRVRPQWVAADPLGLCVAKLLMRENPKNRQTVA